jgi:hypothetical protein
MPAPSLGVFSDARVCQLPTAPIGPGLSVGIGAAPVSVYVVVVISAITSSLPAAVPAVGLR